jgi:hypothetical protein
MTTNDTVTAYVAAPVSAILPAWMSILIDSLVTAGLAHKFKNRGKTESGTYMFITGQGEEESHDEIIFGWDEHTTAKAVIDHFKRFLSSDVKMLVGMAEEYAQKRKGLEESKLCRYLMQLMIARTTELYAKESPGTPLIIEGDFSLIGQLPPNGRLRINGNVKCVEGSIGALLEVKCKDMPELHICNMAIQKDGVWKIERKPVPNCGFSEAPITGFYLHK